MMNKIIGIAIVAALVLYSMFAGGNGATLADSATVKQDEKTAIGLIDEIAKTQARYENVRGFVPDSISAPATDDGGYVGSAIAISNAYTDMLKMKNGDKFTYLPNDGSDKETYLDFSGIKFYTAQVVASVQLDANGTMGYNRTYKMFIDLTGYTGNPTVLANLEQTICDKVREKFGETRTKCSGTEETITSFSPTTEIKLTNAEVVADHDVDGDGLITVSVVDKEKFN